MTVERNIVKSKSKSRALSKTKTPERRGRSRSKKSKSRKTLHRHRSVNRLISEENELQFRDATDSMLSVKPEPKKIKKQRRRSKSKSARRSASMVIRVSKLSISDGNDFYF